jgi:hypothetical protein
MHFCPSCSRRHFSFGGTVQKWLGFLALVAGLAAWVNRHELHRFVCWR